MDQDAAERDTPERPHQGFHARLTPHRSLGPRGFLLLMSVICAVSFIAGIIFFLAGAWPVVGFFGLDVLLVYVAFKLNYASARAYETVKISGDELIVRRVLPGRPPKQWKFHPYWVRVEMDSDGELHGPLYLTSHGARLQIGAFLSGDERRDFADALKDALSHPA